MKAMLKRHIEDASRLIAPCHKACLACGRLFAQQNRGRKTCSEECKRKHKRNVKNAWRAENPRTRVKYRCTGCGKEGSYINNWRERKTTLCVSCIARQVGNEAANAKRLKCMVKMWAPPKPRQRKGLDLQWHQRVTMLISRDCAECGKPTWNNCNSPGGYKFCSDECKRTAGKRYRQGIQDSHRKRARKTGAEYQRGITAKKVAERDGMTCQVCKRKVSAYIGGKGKYNPRWWSVGHIIPMSQGGPHTWANVQCECVECNSNKGTTALGQFSLAV